MHRLKQIHEEIRNDERVALELEAPIRKVQGTLRSHGLRTGAASFERNIMNRLDSCYSVEGAAQAMGLSDRIRTKNG